jgi:hypothetical protein
MKQQKDKICGKGFQKLILSLSADICPQANGTLTTLKSG